MEGVEVLLWVVRKCALLLDHDALPLVRQHILLVRQYARVRAHVLRSVHALHVPRTRVLRTHVPRARVRVLRVRVRKSALRHVLRVPLVPHSGHLFDLLFALLCAHWLVPPNSVCVLVILGRVVPFQKFPRGDREGFRPCWTVRQGR